MHTSLTSHSAKLIADFGRMIGIPNLSFSANGSCQLLFDKVHLVNVVMVPALEKLVLSCRCASDQIDACRLAHLALRANFMGYGSAGASLSLGPDDHLHLQCQLPLQHLSPEALMTSVEGLLNGVENWNARLRPVPATLPMTPAPALFEPQRG